MTKSKRHIRKFFIPHKHNNYHPHLFRSGAIFFIFATCIFLLGISFGSSVFLRKTVLGATIETNVLIDLANQSRQENNIPGLVRNAKLDSAAQMKAADMLQNKYFAHYSPEGTTPWYFIKQAGYDFIYAGENLAVNFFDSKSLENAWMNSESHRANLLNTNFRDIGIATVEGTYNGMNSVYVVQMFGSQTKFPQVANPNLKANVKVLVQSKNFLSFKNEDNLKVLAPRSNSGVVAGVETYSSWWEKLIYNDSYYIQIFYLFIIFILVLGLMCRTFIEFKKQHYKHLAASIIFLLIILVIATLNSNFVNIF